MKYIYSEDGNTENFFFADIMVDDDNDQTYINQFSVALYTYFLLIHIIYSLRHNPIIYFTNLSHHIIFLVNCVRKLREQ